MAHLWILEDDEDAVDVDVDEIEDEVEEDCIARFVALLVPIKLLVLIDS